MSSWIPTALASRRGSTKPLIQSSKKADTKAEGANEGSDSESSLNKGNLPDRVTPWPHLEHSRPCFLSRNVPFVSFVADDVTGTDA